jgi:proteic killer suppression protein
MIRSFKNKGLKRFAETGDGSKLSVQNVEKIRKLLNRLDGCIEPQDMNLPGLYFHELGGDRKGFFSVRVTGNWRITFKWDGRNAVDVDLEDYH